MTDYAKMHREYDAQGNAKHYSQGGIENWDVLKARLTREELIGFLKGTIFNYVMNNRSELSDFVKSKWYSDKLAELSKEKL